MKASQTRTAFSSMAWKIGFNSPGDVLMMRNTSADAVSRSSASSRSRLNSATFASLPATEELRRCTDFDALRRLGVVVLRRCNFADLPPALERRLIAFPKAQDKASCRLKIAHWNVDGVSLAQVVKRPANVRFGSKADITNLQPMSALPPIADVGTRPLCAKSGHCRSH